MITPGSRHHPITLDQVAGMLQYVSPENRDIWLRTSMAVKSEFGDAGFNIWDSWSQQADSYEPRSARDVWRSIGPGGVTIGTLIHLAQQHGYQNPTTKQRADSGLTAREQKRATGSYAKQLWLSGSWADDYVRSHTYAQAKGITWAAGAKRGIASGRVIGRDADCILVPIRNIESDALQGVQCINPDGDKQTFGIVTGGALILGNTRDKSIEWYSAEGWASAVSVVFHHRQGNAVCACTFGKHNLERVAQLMARVYCPDEITILLERDR